MVHPTETPIVMNAKLSVRKENQLMTSILHQTLLIKLPLYVTSGLELHMFSPRAHLLLPN